MQRSVGGQSEMSMVLTETKAWEPYMTTALIYFASFDNHRIAVPMLRRELLLSDLDRRRALSAVHRVDERAGRQRCYRRTWFSLVIKVQAVIRCLGAKAGFRRRAGEWRR